MARVLGDSHTFGVEWDRAEVSSWAETDPRWKYVDLAGHVHEYAYRKPLPQPFDTLDDVDKYDPYTPTLRWIIESEADDEWPETGHYECVECGAEVSPGTRASPVKRYVLRDTLYLIDGERVEEAEWHRRFDEARTRGR